MLVRTDKSFRRGRSEKLLLPVHIFQKDKMGNEEEERARCSGVLVRLYGGFSGMAVSVWCVRPS